MADALFCRGRLTKGVADHKSRCMGFWCSDLCCGVFVRCSLCFEAIDDKPGGFRTEPRECHGLFQRDVVGELGLWRRPHHSRVNSPTAPDMHRQASGDEHSDCFLLKYGNEIK